MPVIKGILDDLWQKNVLSTEDKDSVTENQTSKVDRARCLIDMVMGKGDRASQMMVDSLMDRDGELWFSLGLIPSPGMELSRIRADFVQKVSISVIKRLLDDLWQKNVLSTEDKDSVMENQTSKVDRARCLIDMVMGKGDRASQMMVDSLKDRDGELCISLGLIPSPELSRIRADFVQKVPMPVIKGLLDDLWQKKVLSTEDKDSVTENQTSKVDRARCLIDMVMGKGERASQMMVDSMKVRDMELCISLGLIPSPLPGMEVSSVENWSSKLIPSPDILKTEILKDIDDIYPVMAPDARTSPALLITNVHFDNMPLRKGAEKDEQNMENLLTSLGYTVVKYRDLSGVQMDEAIEKFSQDARLPEADSVFVVIMSHGQRGAVLGVRHSGDGEADTLPVDNIYKHLDSARCPGLLNKPKVIIIQACRGGTQPEDTEEHIEDDGFRRVHKEKDMIALLSCTPDTVSYRHAAQGSFCIRYIVDIFNAHAHKDHIEELFRKVMKRFEENAPSATKRQMPVKDRCSLTKYFYLFPHGNCGTSEHVSHYHCWIKLCKENDTIPSCEENLIFLVICEIVKGAVTFRAICWFQFSNE
ncbi:hypothetical protein NHX12_000083 [Muraenolepis orangiensis]|uniref:Caspase-8 n=1 Tax=Muraenolepis orangiensis TaxID=630683 RepID=A0A9Q0D6W1_9TELE|nr:hypothetical protein NHX12_000083 [Muraenolepis orangiensis]